MATRFFIKFPIPDLKKKYVSATDGWSSMIIAVRLRVIGDNSSVLKHIYKEVARFESRLGHWISRLRF
jgi:hypothetical protein